MLLAAYVIGAWLAASIPTTAVFALLFRGADCLATDAGLSHLT